MHATKKTTIQPKQREPRVRQFAMIISLAAIGCGTAEPAGTGGVAVIDAGVTLGADTGPTPPDVGPPPGCDQDGDGFLALECDGNDCDDRDRSRHPEAAERCSFVTLSFTSKITSQPARSRRFDACRSSLSLQPPPPGAVALSLDSL